jgi:PAS domain-containing protein
MNELSVGNVDPQFYRILVESAKDYAIILLDPTGRIVTWNEGARQIKGYTAIAGLFGPHRQGQCEALM